MRITQDVVKRAADWATEVTGGQFVLQAIGASLGHGTRYIDGIQQLVWLGSTGARQATAYYLSAGVTWAELSGVEVPSEHAATLAFLRGGGQARAVIAAGERGAADARHRHQHPLRFEPVK